MHRCVVHYAAMNADESIAKIPISNGILNRRITLLWGRQFTQIGTIILLFLLPITGLFRVDLSSGFVILDRQIWFGDFLIVFGFWLAAACTLIFLYSTAGTVFCGWICPQNTFSSLANKWTFKALGKRAEVDWEGDKSVQIANRKNKLINWLLLGIKLLLSSMLISLIPLFYFQEPAAMWSFVTLQEDERLASSLHWIYSVFVFITFVNLAVIRHFMCRYMCIYRMWQFLFKTKDTLHVNYDESRAKDCEKCSYCVSSCMVDIDPRQTTVFDSCTNCGACIVACDTMHQKKAEPGLLSFKLGPRNDAYKHQGTRSIASLKNRVIWVLPVWLLGVGLFAWGLYTYQPYNLAVYKSETNQDGVITGYQINLASKFYRQARVQIDVQGIPENTYRISQKSISFETANRKNSYLIISGDLTPGIYPLTIKVRSEDGWTDSFRVQHVVAKRS